MNIPLNTVHHMHPAAAAIFVRGFGEEIYVTDAVVAQTSEEIKEITAISVSLTVRNNPGTFNITISDNSNKFIIPDTPQSDIPAFFEYSRGKITSEEKNSVNAKIGTQFKLISPRDKINSMTTTGGIQTSTSLPQTTVVIPAKFSTGTYGLQGGNFYEFPFYNDWITFGNILIIDPKTLKKYPTQYIRDSNNNVIERWAFLDDGTIVFVCKSASDEDNLQGLLDATGANNATISSVTFNVSSYYSSKHSTETMVFDVQRITNSSLTDTFKEIDEQGDNNGQFKKGKCKISPMDRVILFMSPRFREDGAFNESNKEPVVQVFTGVVNSVQQGYAENKHTITIQGEDVTKYLKISVINVNPALDINSMANVDQHQDENVNVWSNILQGLTTPDIIRLLCLGSSQLRNKGEGLNQKVDGIGLYKLATGDKYSYTYDLKTNTFSSTRAGTKAVKQADFSKMLGSLFRPSSVHIIDPFRPGTTGLQGFRPYELSLNNSWSFFQGDFKTRRDIAYKASEDSHFNFYADRDGHIWFHPQRFDISWIFSAPNPKVYIIDNPSIISYGFIEDDTELFTSVYVDTEPDFAMEGTTVLGIYRGSFNDEVAVLKYGQRIFVASNPIINTKFSSGSDLDPYFSASLRKQGPSISAEVYAKSLLQRILAGKYQGQITIAGRPELDPGRPVYIPMRNMVYYVETAEHSLTYNQSFQTTLHLSYGHKPWEYLPELLTFAGHDEVYLTDASILSRKGVVK